MKPRLLEARALFCFRSIVFGYAAKNVPSPHSSHPSLKSSPKHSVQFGQCQMVGKLRP